MKHLADCVKAVIVAWEWSHNGIKVSDVHAYKTSDGDVHVTLRVTHPGFPDPIVAKVAEGDGRIVWEGA